MSLERVECKDNNSADVKRIMPESFCDSQQIWAQLPTFSRINNSRKSQKELDARLEEIIIIFTDIAGSLPAANGRPDTKRRTLQQQGTLNPRPKAVRDELFLLDDFFDPRDLVQVKYEMLRRVRTEGKSVTDAAGNFGFSRPSFYQAQSAFEQDGLAGLVPHKRGPKQAHKLTEEVLTFIGEVRQKEPVHSIAGPGKTDPGTLRHQGSSTKYRAQSAAPSKKTPLNGASGTPATQQDLAVHYEQLRRDAIGRPAPGGEGWGLALFLRRGMTAWMQAWSECAANVQPATRSQPGVSETIPVDMRSQITSLLAGMILSLQQEANL